jgi:hypothetical protein
MIVAPSRPEGGRVSTADGADQGPEVVSDDWAVAAGAVEPVASAVRPGPPVLDADAWEEHGDPDTSVEAYEGRRRASGRSLRMWVVVGLVLLGLGAVVAVPLALVANRGESAPAAAPTSRGEPTTDETVPGASLVPATGAAPVPTTTAKPPPRQTAPAFSVTLEAEARSVQLSGSAWVDDYPGASGGKIVRNVGEWTGRPGTVKFTVTLPATGAYVITIWYVHLDGEQTRSAQISVSGADTVTRTFTGSSTCCASLALNPITLSEGSHTVTIANPTGRAPSIDKISITRA